MQHINGEGGTVINRFPDMVARGFTYVVFLLQRFIGCLANVRSSASITDSVLEKLQSDPLIDCITPDRPS